MGFKRSCLQWTVLCLVSGQDVLTAATVLPQLGHLLPQRGVFPLQEGGAHRDLVLLQPPRVTRALCCQIVLLSPGPVFVILREWVDVNKRKREVWSNMTNISKGFVKDEHLHCENNPPAHLWSLIHKLALNTELPAIHPWNNKKLCHLTHTLEVWVLWMIYKISLSELLANDIFVVFWWWRAD